MPDLSWANLQSTNDPVLAHWLEGASRGPHVKAVAILAVDAAARGVSAAQWRHDLLVEHPDASEFLAEAEEYIRVDGLWPWP